MKKASYRLLQWTMLMGTAAMMATACVVTSDDDDDDFFNGGEGGTGSSTAGKTSTEGGDGTTAGTASGGTASGGSGGSGGTAGSTAGGTGGSGGTGSSYVAGLCEGADPEPSSLPSCDPSPNDEGQTCKICLKAQCCTEWKTCFGDTPTSACGWGATEEAAGQFDCIQNCYLDTPNAADDFMGTLEACQEECLNQCEDAPEDMGFITSITQDLLICATEADKCLDECFPAE